MADESLLEFPCEFPIKMMGRDTPQFRTTARSLVENLSGPVGDEAVRIALSSNGSFVSVTVTITATSQNLLDDIYRAVSAHDDVLLAL